jgi:hypothetical protein
MIRDFQLDHSDSGPVKKLQNESTLQTLAAMGAGTITDIFVKDATDFMVGRKQALALIVFHSISFRDLNAIQQ